MNTTFSIIKPDATERNLTGSINKIIEDEIQQIKEIKGFRMVSLSYEQIEDAMNN